MKIGVFPGSFDPFTLGHLEVAKKGLELFDELILLVTVNPAKSGFLPLQARMQSLQGLFDRVRVDSHSGLLVDYMRKHDLQHVLRGIRNQQDLEFEFQMEAMNKGMYAQIQYVYVNTGDHLRSVSSGWIRQIHTLGGDVSAWVPTKIMDVIRRNKNG
jgi:pantetheine-phosphate adenylyltransferase